MNVLLECLKHKTNFPNTSDLFFYRDSNHNEIDLVIASGSTTHLVEIKQTATPRAAHFDAMKRLLPLFPKAHAYVALANETEERLAPNLSALPWHQVAARVFEEEGHKPERMA